jgi:hypothetical protein
LQIREPEEEMKAKLRRTFRDNNLEAVYKYAVVVVRRQKGERTKKTVKVFDSREEREGAFKLARKLAEGEATTHVDRYRVLHMTKN